MDIVLILDSLTGKPSKPGAPEITDYDNSFCDIKWSPSESDGGSPITHYIVQTKTNNGDWTQEDTLQTPKGDEKLEMKTLLEEMRSLRQAQSLPYPALPYPFYQYQPFQLPGVKKQ